MVVKLKRVKKVVGVAFIENGKLLIVRSVRSSKSNTWTLIGGGVEEGESEVESLRHGIVRTCPSEPFESTTDLVSMVCV